MLEFLCQFDFEIKHVKGKEIKVVDTLNRRMHLAEISLCKSNLKEIILDASSKGEVYLQIKEVVKQKNEDKKYVDYELDERECLVYKGHLYIHNAQEVQNLVLEEMHQNPYA